MWEERRTVQLFQDLTGIGGQWPCATGIGRGDVPVAFRPQFVHGLTEEMDFAIFSSRRRSLRRRKRRPFRTAWGRNPRSEVLGGEAHAAESRMYWLMCSALGSTSLPAGVVEEVSVFRTQAVGFEDQIHPAVVLDGDVQSLPDFPVKKSAASRPRHRPL